MTLLDSPAADIYWKSTFNSLSHLFSGICQRKNLSCRQPEHKTFPVHLSSRCPAVLTALWKSKFHYNLKQIIQKQLTFFSFLPNFCFFLTVKDTINAFSAVSLWTPEVWTAIFQMCVSSSKRTSADTQQPCYREGKKTTSVCRDAARCLVLKWLSHSGHAVLYILGQGCGFVSWTGQSDAQRHPKTLKELFTSISHYFKVF